MKLLYTFIATMLLLAAGSCSDSDSTKRVTAESIEGCWVIKMIDGEELYTNEYFICRFNSDSSEDYFILDVDSEGSTTIKYTDDTTYRVVDGTIYMTSGIVELEFPATTYTGTLCGEKGEILRYSESVNIQEGNDENSNRTFTAIRCDVDYSAEIVGLWEGEVIEGDEDEPFNTLRMEFESGGKYNFYSPDGAGAWTQLEQGNTYLIMGNLLATQWDEAGSDTTSAEIWVTTIDGDNMTWRASREGRDNPAGFDLVKVVE